MDESPLAERALEHALAEHPDAEITVLHVVDFTRAGYSAAEFVPGYWEEWYDQEQAAAEELFEAARAVAAEHGAEIATVTEVGTTPQAIVDYADEHDVDHVVMGSHGRQGASRILLGSVAETVIRRAPVPVTVVR